MKPFGDRLFDIVFSHKQLLFIQGETAQLTYQAYSHFVGWINETEGDNITVTFPVGYRADKTAMNSTHNYPKPELISRYEYLANNQLPINGIYQLVTITEVMLGDILKEVLSEFSSKIPNKRKVDAEIILEAASLSEIKGSIINSILNELAYKNPKEFAEEFNKFIGVNLLEEPAFHKYIELKATRDIYIHNSGVANSIYTSKAATLARVKSGEALPVTIQYFLESYESCLQLTEILESSLNKIWPSLEYQDLNKETSLEQQQEEAIEQAVVDASEASEVKQEMGTKKKISLKPKMMKGISKPKNPDTK